MSPAFVDNDGNFDWRKLGYHARSGFAVLLSLAVLVGGGWFVYAKAQDAWVDFRTADDYIGEGTDDVVVIIPSGASVTQMGDILVENDVVKSTKEFRNQVSKLGVDGQLQAGRFQLRKQIPAATAVDMLLDPANRVVLRVTIPEGLAVTQQWDTMSKALDVPREEFEAAGAQPEALGLPEWAGGKLEGFMFPDTYEVAEPVNPTAVMSGQVSTFTKVAEELQLAARAEALGRTPLEVLTVASIVEREVNQAEDRPLVASVIYNRLAQDMPLQMDSTIHYALQDFSKVTTTAEDRQVDSPYNTYANKGLPPGPTSNPGRAAIEAAANPADTDYLYFTTVDLDTSETRFAATYEEHEVNVALFQEWCQANTGRC